jgi:hypothetical protein
LKYRTVFRAVQVAIPRSKKDCEEIKESMGCEGCYCAGNNGCMAGNLSLLA